MELAACYRLLAHYKMTDLIYTHATVRVPGEPGHFLINPLRPRWEEITASSLVKIDVDGRQDRRQSLPRESRGFHHPQRRPHGAARRGLRHPHPYARRHGGLGDEGRLAADQPDRVCNSMAVSAFTTMRASRSISTNASASSAIWAAIAA